MSYEITKSFKFSASHQLAGLPEGHRCGRLHGHNYEVDLTLAGLPDDAGMVFDYGRLQPFDDLLADRYEHRHLNDVVVGNPTAERLAFLLYHDAIGELRLPAGVTVAAVAVHETPRTTAVFRHASR
jgi:6-pyruvoyltetrahydropterin/6-carboxytetrahydropterin synthase